MTSSSQKYKKTTKIVVQLMINKNTISYLYLIKSILDHDNYRSTLSDIYEFAGDMFYNRLNDLSSSYECYLIAYKNGKKAFRKDMIEYLLAAHPLFIIYLIYWEKQKYVFDEIESFSEMMMVFAESKSSHNNSKDYLDVSAMYFLSGDIKNSLIYYEKYLEIYQPVNNNKYLLLYHFLMNKFRAKKKETDQQFPIHNF